MVTQSRSWSVTIARSPFVSRGPFLAFWYSRARAKPEWLRLLGYLLVRDQALTFWRRRNVRLSPALL